MTVGRARRLPWRPAGPTDLAPADLLVVRAALTAGAAPAAALAEVANPVVVRLTTALRGGASIAEAAAQAPLPPTAGALVRVLLVAEGVGAPAGAGVDAVMTALAQQARLRDLVAARAAQALSTARFLVAMPVAGGLGLLVLHDGVRAVLLGPVGAVVAVAAGTLIGLGALWIRALLRRAGRAGGTSDPLLADPRLGVAPCHPGDLPTAEVVDLLAMALAAGTSLADAARTVAAVGPPGARPVLDRAARRLAGGLPPPEALPGPLREVAVLLAITDRWGAPAAEALRALARDLRDRAAASAEAAAERLTVHLVLPTTLLLVPAFALLVVVPLVAASFRALGAE